MIQMLQCYKRDREQLMQQYVAERLNKSYNQYSKELQQTLDFLTRKHEKSLLKRMTKQ